MAHVVSHRINPPPAGASGNMASATPVCTCGWEGSAVYEYNDDMLWQLSRQGSRHILQAERDEAASFAATLKEPS